LCEDHLFKLLVIVEVSHDLTLEIIRHNQVRSKVSANEFFVTFTLVDLNEKENEEKVESL
jgi:hypothetical protein